MINDNNNNNKNIKINKGGIIRKYVHIYIIKK